MIIFCQNVRMNEQAIPVEDPKLQAILKSAFDSFARYGFRRTTMEDIAHAAGMSRPALYLHFRNKEDIFRALVQVFYDDAVAQVASALELPGTAEEVLRGAFAAQSGEIKETLLTSPHGSELMDTSTATSADIALAGEGRLVALYARWLEREADAGRIAPQDDPQAVAALFVAALHAVKCAPYSRYVAQRDRLALLLGRGLRG